MEDYIYILVGIIWVVFSIIKGRQQNKPSKQSEDHSPTPGKKSSLEEFLEEFLPPERQPETIYESYDDDVVNRHEEVPLENTEYQAYSGIFEDNFNDEAQSLEEIDYSPKMSLTSFENDEEAFTEDQAPNRFHFDLRQAVIYNTILSRSYV